jgi:dienelactone hydrolase
MALFEYFPNYIWNLSVAMALESGAKIGEIIDMCQPIRDAADSGADAGTPQFMAQWVLMADRLIGLADEDVACGRSFSASDKLERAALYLLVAERMQAQGTPGRAVTYARARKAFDRSTGFGGLNRERVEVPLARGTMPALYTHATKTIPALHGARRPVVVYCNGLDSCKELLWWSRLPEALARRGIASLCVDQPGSGEALRLQNLPVEPHSEGWAACAVDWLEQRSDVDATRIGMAGISLGGHFVPRAVAYEPRFAAGAVWGANHDWAEVQQRRLKREGENPVPHYWAHVHWAFGARDMPDFLDKARAMTLEGHLDRIRVPFLVVHGEKDRQIPLEYAHRTFSQLINSPARELKVLTAREGGVEHVGADNMSYARDYIADWFAAQLGGRSTA